MNLYDRFFGIVIEYHNQTGFSSQLQFSKKLNGVDWATGQNTG